MLIRLCYLVIILFLVGCGGGGGGNRAIDSMNPVSPDPLPTATELRSDFGTIGRAAGSPILTDLITTPRSRVAPNERAYCGNSGGCEPSWGEPYYDELSRIPTDATLRIRDQLYGINNVEISGQESIRELDEGVDFSADYRIYGGWLSTNFFGVEQKQWRGQERYGSVEGLESLIAFSEGTESRSNPVTGSAEWTGLVVALDQTAPDQVVQGKAALTYDFGAHTLDVLFSNLQGARTYGDLSWNDLTVTNGRFSQGSEKMGRDDIPHGDNYIDGTFYGGVHEEAGGVFERNQLIGAFGAKR